MWENSTNPVVPDGERLTLLFFRSARLNIVPMPAERKLVRRRVDQEIEEL